MLAGGQYVKRGGRNAGRPDTDCLSMSVIGLADAKLLRQQYQIGKRARPHLAHRLPAVNLDGNLADADLARNLLVQQSCHGQSHDFGFAWRECGVVRPNLINLANRLAAQTVFLQRGGYGVQQILVAKRLGHEVFGTGLHGRDAHGDVSVPSHEDDRNMNAHLPQPGLQIQSPLATQPQMAFGIQSIDRQTLKNNVVGLAKAAMIFNIPTTISTVESESFSGYTFPELLDVFPNAKTLERSSMNSWDDQKVRDALKAAGRKKIVAAGLWTEVCITTFALCAMQDAGYEFYVVADACGGNTREAHDYAMQRMI